MGRPVRRIGKTASAASGDGTSETPLGDDIVGTVERAGTLKKVSVFGRTLTLQIEMVRPIAEPADETQAQANVGALAQTIAIARGMVGREIVVGVEGAIVPPIGRVENHEIKHLVDDEKLFLDLRRRREFRDRLLTNPEPTRLGGDGLFEPTSPLYGIAEAARRAADARRAAIAEADDDEFDDR